MLVSNPKPCHIATANSAVPMTATIVVSHLASAPSSFSSGDAVAVVSWVMFAILPISVFMPVATTTPVAVPEAAVVPTYAMLSRSPMTEAVAIALVPLPCGVDSPVSEKSFVRRSNDSMIRMSAGIRSPASMWMMSPNTSFSWETSESSPSTITFAGELMRLFRLSTIFCALCSCTNPITALTTTITSITVPSRTLPIVNEMTAAMTHFGILKSAVSSLGPCSLRRFSASSRGRPLGVVPRESRVSWTLIWKYWRSGML
jgi:hypothetical protein